MNLFSLFRKRKSVIDVVIDERVITPALLAKHGVEVRHLINGKWAAWHVGISDRGGIDRDTGYVRTAASSMVKYVWCDTRERALLAAVRYLATKGVKMPEPKPTGVPVKPSELKTTPPEVTPLPKPVPHTEGGIDVSDLRKPEFPHHDGGTIPADW